MIGEGGKGIAESGKRKKKERNIHSSFHLPLIQTNHACLIHTSRIERMQARLIAFEPHVLRFHEACFCGFRSVPTTFEDA